MEQTGSPNASNSFEDIHEEAKLSKSSADKIEERRTFQSDKIDLRQMQKSLRNLGGTPTPAP